MALTYDGTFVPGGTIDFDVSRVNPSRLETLELFVVRSNRIGSVIGNGFFLNAIPGPDGIARDVSANGVVYDLEYTSADIRARNFRLVDTPCSLADIRLPFGVVDLDDADAFITLFLVGDPSVDFVPPQGVVDLDDVDAFVTAFLGGCP